MSKRKMHSQRHLPYASPITWTICGRRVERSQIAAFRDGVTCRQCVASLEWSDDIRRELARDRAAAEPAPDAAE